MTLSSAVTVQFSPGAAAQPFRLVLDNRDADDNWGLVHDRAALLTPEQKAQPAGRYKQPVEMLRYGRAVVRLYAPAGSLPTLTSLSPTSGDPEQLTTDRVKFHSSGYDGRDVVLKGRRIDERVEQLVFDGATEQQIEFWYGNPTVTVISESDFVDQDGRPAPTPVFRHYGKFQSPSAVSGSLVVRYRAEYWEYWVYYDVADLYIPYELIAETAPDGSIIRNKVWWPWAMGDSDERWYPDLHIIARLGRYQDLLSIPRTVQDWSVTYLIDDDNDDDADVEYRERELLTVEERAENPSDPSQFVLFDREHYVVYQNAKGRRLVLRRPE